jgi:iron complex outermembrane recepter protein
MRKTKRPVSAFAKKSCVAATQVALAMMAAPLAFGQQAEVQKGERIEITGTRIPSPNLESASPVAVISAQDIKFEGVTRVEDMLNSLPQVFADYGANLSNGATGTATVNLRNLGATRTLVLMNGKRLPIGDPQPFTAGYPPDINQVPAPLIQRIEVLTGGASAVYGSDAVAGVVNFIMRDNFEGVQGDVNYSWYQHGQHGGTTLSEDLRNRSKTNPAQFNYPDDMGSGGESTEASLLLGGNFAGGKGNATVFLDYKKDKPLDQSRYDYSACASGPGGGENGDDLICGGSSTNATGRFNAHGVGIAGTSTATIIDAAGNVRAFSSAKDQYNFAPSNYFQRPDERYGASVFAHYDVNPHVRVYEEFSFHDSHTIAQIAPSGAFAYVDVPLTADNPLLSQSFKNFFGITPDNPVTVGVARRNVEGGGRQDDLRHTSRRAVLGVKGDIFKNWDYDLYMQTSSVIFSEVQNNYFSTARIKNALNVVTDPATGRPVCASVLSGSDPACIPWDIFHAGGVTPASLAYLSVPALSKGSTDQRVQGLNLSSDLGNYGWRFPGSKQGLGFAAGIERRVDQLEIRYDDQFHQGTLAGSGGPRQDLHGEVEVKDYYAEIRVPIRDFLSFNGSYRYSDYSTGKTTDSYGLGIELTPWKTVKFRGSYQQAVRAPNIVELFAAQGLGLFNMGADPCGTDPVIQPTPRASAVQCARSGVTAAQYGSPNLISPAGQYNGFFGGNPDLNAETAKTYTVGIVLTPWRNLSATVDYFNIKVEDIVGTLSGSQVVNQCVFAGQFCNFIHRDSFGTLWSSDNGSVTLLNTNIGSLETEGVDVALNYNWNIGKYGGLAFNFIGTWVDKLHTDPVPGLGLDYDCAGYYGSVCGTPIPQWRHKFRTVWSSPWNMDLAVTWRHMDEVKLDATSSNPNLAGPFAGGTATLGARDYMDIAATWNVWKQVTLRFGVNNVFDRDPPLSDSSGPAGAPFGNGNTFPQVYDSLGRKFFTGLTVNF